MRMFTTKTLDFVLRLELEYFFQSKTRQLTVPAVVVETSDVIDVDIVVGVVVVMSTKLLPECSSSLSCEDEKCNSVIGFWE